MHFSKMFVLICNVLVCCFTGFSSENSLLQDSVFENVDLSMLEKACLEAQSNSPEKDSHNCVPQPNVQPDGCCTHQQLSTPTKNSEIPVASSTPNVTAVDNQTRITQRIRQRLRDNAHKTPQNIHTAFNNRVPSMQSRNVFGKSQPMSSYDIGPFYGLPSKVQDLLKSSRGIDALYEWQDQCLRLDSVMAGKNLIYTLPTSGGKTLVAEILMMQELLCKKKNAIFILPFVAIVQEKIQSLSVFAAELGFLVEEYAGSKGRFPPRKRRSKKDMYICTIEKANSLVNSLIEHDRLSEIGLVVVDELHMLGEGGKRGATLESTLAKVMYVATSTQIIGMSATIGNIYELAVFLKAEVYSGTFRPVQLDEYIKVNDSVFKVDRSHGSDDQSLRFDRMIGHSGKMLAKKDPDHLATLVLEVVPEHSCLIFCATKKNCENVATMICKLLPDDIHNHKSKERRMIIEALRAESDGNICPVLRITIPFGVAYHHSGLTSDERRIIETAYREGVVSVITCTSTLAAGVNLPARRVIIRSPHIGRNFLSHAQYKQMSGRAGRAGIDSKGESYLIATSSSDKPKIQDLVVGKVETCLSSLMYDQGKGFKSLLLNLIGLNIIQKSTDVCEFFNQTLYANQLQRFESPTPNVTSYEPSDPADSALSRTAYESLQHLADLGLIQFDECAGKIIKVTNLGRAAHKSSADLEMAGRIFSDLQQGLRSLNLQNYLHLLFLVTPYEAARDIKPDWLVYMSEMSKLSASELAAADIIGVPEQYIAMRASGRNLKRKTVQEYVVKRFYITMMLYLLFQGNTVWKVSARFDQPRGFLQNLLTSSIAFASCVLHFSSEVKEFWPYPPLLENLIRTMQYSSVADLVPLMEIPGVKLARARQLFKANYKTLSSLAAANAHALCRAIEHLSRKQAEQIIASATILLREKIDSLQEEIDELM